MSGKVNIFLFAAHHAAGNIASLRFRGLLKYLDTDKYRVYVFSREGSGVSSTKGGAVEEEIRLSGYCIGRNSTLPTTLIGFVAVFFRLFPFLSGLRKRSQGNSWLVNALIEADLRCRKHLHMGEKCVVMGTYSPIDALIASASLSARYGLPCIQDFRDGFVFESLGRGGWLAGIMRRIVERRMVDPASLVVSVSPALVADFECRYAGKAVKLLPNGFDPDDFLVSVKEDEQEAVALLNRYIPQDVRLVGHFGRVGASDSSASQSFGRFINAMNGIGDASLHLLLVGDLTLPERKILKGARFGVTVLDATRRGVALSLMKKCSHLLLITGDRVSCATGKIFEYIASGVPVVCFTGVRNAASEIISKTGAGQTVVSSDAGEDVNGLREALASSANARYGVGLYSKVAQAKELALMFEEIIAAREWNAQTAAIRSSGRE